MRQSRHKWRREKNVRKMENKKSQEYTLMTTRGQKPMA